MSVAENSCRMKDRSTKLFCPGSSVFSTSSSKVKPLLFFARFSHPLSARPSYLRKSERLFASLIRETKDRRLKFACCILATLLSDSTLYSDKPGVLDSWFGCCLLLFDFSVVVSGPFQGCDRKCRTWSYRNHYEF